MDSQIAFNIGIALISALGGWVLNSLRESIASLHISDAQLADKVQAIELLVAGQYVKKDDLEKLSAALFNKLDKIDSKLDSKEEKRSANHRSRRTDVI